MKLFNYIIEGGFTSRHKWSHMRLHKRPYYNHFVWGKLSILYGQPHLEPIEVHIGCGGTVHGIGEDLISYCEDCEHICEGETHYITTEEWEALNN